MCLKHIDYLSKIKPEKLVCLEIRNHIAWYLKGLKNSNLVKEKVYQATKVYDIINILKKFVEDYDE
jgi:tRNA-dihydrouridine synthase